jgi:hypothetical protein
MRWVHELGDPEPCCRIIDQIFYPGQRIVKIGEGDPLAVR